MRQRKNAKKINRFLKNHEKSILSHFIVRTFEDGSPTPHVLVELSKTEQRRLSSNCIHLNGVKTCQSNDTLIYSSVTYGSNIRKRKSTVTFDGKSVPSYEISVQSIKRKFFMITVQKSDALAIFPQLLTSMSTYNEDPSGILLLMVCVSRPIAKIDKNWDIEDYKKLKRCKPNILQNSNHHESSGYYSSFGNKGSYKMTNSSSVGQYATKKHSKLSKQIVINEEAAMYESYCAHEISRSIKDLQAFVPNIKSIIAPVIETSYKLQLEEKDLNLTEVPSSSDGCWQTSICIDAETKQYHTEHDCTYTLISVPKQIVSKSIASSIKYDFLFKLTDSQSINVSMKPGVSFMFSGLFLCHRQNKSKDDINCDERFFNMASYGNKRLFHHLRKTYNKK